MGFSNAAATLVGQNLGACKPDRARTSVMLTAKYNAIFLWRIVIVYIRFAQPIISIFTIPKQLCMRMSTALQIIGAGYIFYGIGMVMIQA
jgi:Na+-driven multidrug efflux pump